MSWTQRFYQIKAKIWPHPTYRWFFGITEQTKFSTNFLTSKYRVEDERKQKDKDFTVYLAWDIQKVFFSFIALNAVETFHLIFILCWASIKFSKSPWKVFIVFSWESSKIFEFNFIINFLQNYRATYWLNQIACHSSLSRHCSWEILICVHQAKMASCTDGVRGT